MWRRAIPRRAPHAERHDALVLGVVLALAAFLVVGCGGVQATYRASTPNATATAEVHATEAAAAAQATVAAAPVKLNISVTVQGNAEQHTVVFASTVTVQNRNPFMIALAGDCSTPPIEMVFTNPTTGYSASDALLCSAIPAYDLKPIVPAGDLHTWTLTDNYTGEAALVAGQYTVSAHIYTWHAGTIEQLEKDASTPHGSASATTTVTVP